MLTYESVVIGQRVEVLHDGEVLDGTVLYKGPITGRRGLWLGIDLTTPHGDNDGTLKGRVYFRAPMNYGLFTTVEHVRMAWNSRDKYMSRRQTDLKTVCTAPQRPRSETRNKHKKSFVQEELFGNTNPLARLSPWSDVTISQSKVTDVLKPANLRPASSFYGKQQSFPRSQTLVNKYDNPIERRRKLQSTLIERPWTTEHSFSPAPSIPRVFMPPTEVDRAKHSGFRGMSIPRYTVVYDQQDFLE